MQHSGDNGTGISRIGQEYGYVAGRAGGLPRSTVRRRGLAKSILDAQVRLRAASLRDTLSREDARLPPATAHNVPTLAADLAACRLCAARFVATATAHAPRPLVWFRPAAQLLIASQAPGARAHASGIPFRDASGVRLRDWLGLGEDAFYDRDRVAIVPMGFCFPGYDAEGADLPPPQVCAATWRTGVLATLPAVQLTLAVGGAAQRWQLGPGSVSQRVRDWQTHLAANRTFPLPHPSWRNTGWMARNRWFEAEVLPALRLAVACAMAAHSTVPEAAVPQTRTTERSWTD